MLELAKAKIERRLDGYFAKTDAGLECKLGDIDSCDFGPGNAIGTILEVSNPERPVLVGCLHGGSLWLCPDCAEKIVKNCCGPKKEEPIQESKTP